jgi:hypothetical protein
MNVKEFSEFDFNTGKITANDLQDKSDRTLLFGYTLNRESFHVYLKGGEIFVAVYRHNKELSVTPNEGLNSDYIPCKRVYPQHSDYEFCKLLILRGYDIPFTAFGECDDRQYKGFLLEDLK